MNAFDPAGARRRMVDSQLRPNRVLDKALVAAMAEVPRELFVPAHLVSVAYADEDLPVAPGRYLMEPRVFGRLLQDAGVRDTDRVLDVGCATGYSTAVLAKLAAKVTAIEAEPALLAIARVQIQRLGATNVTLVAGTHAAGSGPGPYDLILINGAIEQLPDALKAQLAEAGRLVAVIRTGGVGKATVIERHGAAYGTRELFDASTPPLPGFERPKQFVF